MVAAVFMAMLAGMVQSCSHHVIAVIASVFMAMRTGIAQTCWHRVCRSGRRSAPDHVHMHGACRVVYTYIYIYIYICMSLLVFVYICVYTCKYIVSIAVCRSMTARIHTHMCIHTANTNTLSYYHTYVHVGTPLITHTPGNADLQPRIYTHAHLQSHRHVHTGPCIHACACSCMHASFYSN